MDEIFSKVYTEITDPVLVEAAKNNIRVHLDKLSKEERVKQFQGKFSIV